MAFGVAERLGAIYPSISTGRGQSTAPLGSSIGVCRTAVCNCDRYLKVPRERMRQLVEGSRQAPGDGGAGCLARTEEKSRQSCDATAPACDTAQPGYTLHGERLEGPEQRGAAAALAGGTVLQVKAIPPGVLDKADLTDFYCCTHCGKVFWEGSHFGRVVSQFQDVLVATGDKQSVYELS
ncbi:exonuclease mut-7 [Grus japonensis]|uniref:Exonuclease mut-7 n=1 Tax=Grus japonensis TaxID=30415 RepID=A0ABC9XKU8_GRUJA